MIQRADRIKAVSFDGDGTLWDFDRVMRGGLQKVLDELRRVAGDRPVRALTVDNLKDIRDELARRHTKGALDHVRLRRESFAVVLADLGLSDKQLHERLCDIYFAHRNSVIELYEDARAILPELRGRARVCLVSNGNTDPRRFGLGHHFDVILLAEECGVEKPDARIFAELLRRADCAPQDAIHVGDSLDNDIRGAKASGLHAVWLNRDVAANDTPVRPDATITHLRQLTALMGRPH